MLNEALHIVPALIFESPEPRLFDAAMVERNFITLDSDPPSWIVKIQEELKKPRPVTQEQLVCLLL